MFQKEAENKVVEAGIISFKNLKSGFLPFGFKEGSETRSIINEEIMLPYLEQMVLLLNEILDPAIAFEEKV
jgi:hypothetical protein